MLNYRKSTVILLIKKIDTWLDKVSQISLEELYTSLASHLMNTLKKLIPNKLEKK